MSDRPTEDSEIIKQVTVDTPRSTVWRLLTDPQLIPRWMSDEELRVIADWRVGGSIAFRGVLHGIRFENRGTITGFEPERLFEYNYWSTLSGTRLPESRDNTSTVRFVLAPLEAGTRLTLTLRDFPEPSIRPHANLYWGPTLQIIKKLAEQETSRA